MLEQLIAEGCRGGSGVALEADHDAAPFDWLTQDSVRVFRSVNLASCFCRALVLAVVQRRNALDARQRDAQGTHAAPRLLGRGGSQRQRRILEEVVFVVIVVAHCG